MNEGQQEQYEKAEQAFDVMAVAVSPDVVYVSAEAQTGSRYTVVASRLPAPAHAGEGGTVLVSVVQPWQTTYVVSDHGDLHPSYVAEKFLRPGRPFDQVHGGDFAGMVLTINAAIGVLGGMSL